MGLLRGSNGHEVGLRRRIYWPFDDEVNYQVKLQENLSNPVFLVKLAVEDSLQAVGLKY